MIDERIISTKKNKPLYSLHRRIDSIFDYKCPEEKKMITKEFCNNKFEILSAKLQIELVTNLI